jgi:Zn-dependent M28 family amino/carboxypeptidase
VGSRFFAKQLGVEEQSKIRAMVNMDSLGLSDTKVWVTRADKALVQAAAGVAHSLNLPLAEVNVEKVGESDSRPFVDNKIPAIDFHSVTQETLPILHSGRDTISAIRLPEYENTYALLVAYLAYLDVTMRAGSSVPQSSNDH